MYTIEQAGKPFKAEWLTVPFAGAEGVPQHYSQAGQDIFTLSCLNGKRNGTFVDLGCNEPYVINNTYLLEEKFGWKGMCFDFDPRFEKLWKESIRTSSMYAYRDATTLDWDIIGSTLGTMHIDYMSLDLEPAAVTLKALENIPLDRISFGVITYEHDCYRFGDEWKIKSRDILTKAGYTLLCNNVDNFEDWWVNEKYVDMNRLQALKTDFIVDGMRHVLKHQLLSYFKVL